MAAAAKDSEAEKAHAVGSGHEEGGREPDPVRGLAVAEEGLKLELDRRELPRGRQARLSFKVVCADGRPVRDYAVEHDKRMHLIVARRDLTGFQHLHPKLGGDGRWRTDGGRRSARLTADVPVRTTADAGHGYRVLLTGLTSSADDEAELSFTVTRNIPPRAPGCQQRRGRRADPLHD